MRTLTATLLCIAFGTAAMAQSQGTLDKAALDSRSCMVMSDSMHHALGVTEDQRSLVHKSDMKCANACEKVGYRTTGQMDEVAMRTHQADMREILTAIQYDRWMAMCGTTKVREDAPEPMEE